jgi:hypothetical protein
MTSSGMLRRVALVRPDVSEERSASIIRVTRISELGTTLAVTSNRRLLRISLYILHIVSSELRRPEHKHGIYCRCIQSVWSFTSVSPMSVFREMDVWMYYVCRRICNLYLPPLLYRIHH